VNIFEKRYDFYPVAHPGRHLNPEKKQALLRYFQTEIRKHHWDTFVIDPPSVADGGRGVVYPGCLTCQKVINTTPEYLNHLCQDVIPKLIEQL
jgi:hypothetical protein